MTEGRPVRSGRSTFWPTVLLGAAGAGLASAAAGQTWATATSANVVHATAGIAGSEVAPLALALSLVTLASWGAVLVLRSVGRRVVAVLGVVAAAGVLVTVAGAGDEARRRAIELVVGDRADAVAELGSWFVLTAVGAGVTLVAFGLALWRMTTWPEMSRRYDAPAGPTATSERLDDTDVWRALDDGRDPTA